MRINEMVYERERKNCCDTQLCSILTVFELIFNGSFQVECLYQSCFMKCHGVTHTSDVYALCRHANTQL